MILKDISFYNFRNIKEEKISLSPNINVFYGQNGEGKTNAVEAVYYLASAKGFRAKKDIELIKFGEETASFGANFEKSGRSGRIKVNLSAGSKKELYIGGIKINKMREFIGEFRAVLFTPDHLSLIKGGPKERRSFIDGALCQINPLYLLKLYQYEKYHEQRNASLRYQNKNGRNDALLDVYDEKIASVGASIITERRRYIEKIRLAAKSFYDEISDQREDLLLKYQNFVPDNLVSEEQIKNYYRDTLYENRESDLKYMQTGAGIHKDDIQIFILGKEARTFASQGQQRSAVLAMKLAEGQISMEETGEYPVFLLDDILSELDKKRQKYIIEKIKNMQVIITSCSLSGLRLKEGASFFVVKKGTFTEKKFDKKSCENGKKKEK